MYDRTICHFNQKDHRAFSKSQNPKGNSAIRPGGSLSEHLLEVSTNIWGMALTPFIVSLWHWVVATLNEPNPGLSDIDHG